MDTATLEASQVQLQTIKERLRSFIEVCYVVATICLGQRRRLREQTKYEDITAV